MMIPGIGFDLDNYYFSDKLATYSHLYGATSLSLYHYYSSAMQVRFQHRNLLPLRIRNV